ncbi:MAG: hypothetical protein BWX86_03003 [Verrucomicrobia bacterium ADurb.Bin122]|nr:MAG: hypothetical protein BWX86_03003 [Verrucomicrobia bacterium ADurb.Bin122]
MLPVWPIAELLISITSPLKRRPGNASILSSAWSPTFTFTMSFSFTFTRISIVPRSATRMISVPLNWPVPTRRSPTSLESELIVPSIGATISVFSR